MPLINQTRLLTYCSVSSFLLGAIVLSNEPAKALMRQMQPPQQTLLAQSQDRLRVAVLDFDYSSLSDPGFLSALFPGSSKGVSDVLVNKLVQSNKFSVIERSKIDEIMREQDMGASGRIDPGTAAQIGRALGVEAVIIGSVTQFDLQERRSGGGLSILGIGARSTDTDAYVKLTARMVDTTTGEILMAAEGNGNVSQSDSEVNVRGISGGSSTSNGNKLLTLATEQAVDEVVTQLSDSSETLATSPDAVPNMSARIADVFENTVVLNKGSSDGFQSGMTVSIERVTREVKDPDTGEVIRQITEPVGMVELYDVDAQSSMGKVVSGSSFQVGDVAKPTQ